MGCLFCKIIAGEIPNYTVFENEHVLAFLDIHPCSNGHTVVIPKKHFGDVESMEAKDWADLATGLKLVCERLQSALKSSGMNIGLNNHASAGQAVPHIHWHIIPRYENDGGGSMHSIIKQNKILPVADTAKLFK